MHAETAAEASTVMVAQPVTASLALSPARAMAVRTFIKPPQASGRGRPVRVPPPKQPPTSENATRPLPRHPENGCPGTATTAKVIPTDGTVTR